LLPDGNSFPSTLYLFNKYFERAVPKAWQKVVICVNEHHIFEDGQVVCPKCGEQRNRILHLTYDNKEVPRKWFYSVDFIELIKHRFAKDPAWVKVYNFILLYFFHLDFALFSIFFF